MPEHWDPYEILGVSRDVSETDLRKAYLKLAHQYHPDKTGGDKEAENHLKEINAAYDVLKNPEKRAQYDRFGASGAGFSGTDPFSGFGGGGFDAPFEDLFDMLFGGRRPGGRGSGRRAAQPGNDIETCLSITLREAALGCKKHLRFDRMETCGECHGTGAAGGKQAEPCPECHGTGQVRVSQGFFSVTRTCTRCRGTGAHIANPCRRCSGGGHVRSTRELSVDVPAGIDTGQRLRLSGEGEPGLGGGPRGDLYVRIEIEPDDIFERDGNTILCEVPISFPEAALGATLRVPTLTGEAELRVAPGTQSGALLRLRGLGMPDVRGYRQGDQIVRIQVETPSRLSKRQRELLDEFERESNSKTYPIHLRFLDKLKGFQQRS